MKATEDIQPLVELATRQFDEKINAAHAALNDLSDFWTRLYGPNEALSPAFDALKDMDATFFEYDRIEA